MHGIRSKKPPSSKHEEVARLTPQRQASLRALVAIARLAIALERRNTGGVASVAVLHDEASVVLVVTPSESPEGGPRLRRQE